MNQSGLVISSVSSLSSTSSQSNYNLPSGISISKAAAEPDINLPKSISISRVEPEIQIVEENISLRQQQQPQQRVGNTMVTRGRGISMRGRGTVVRPNISPRGMGMMTSRGRMITPATRGRPSSMMMSRGMPMLSRGRGIPISSPVKRLVPGGSPMAMSPAKRMGSAIVNPMNAKRMRMPSTQQNNFNIPGYNKIGIYLTENNFTILFIQELLTLPRWTWLEDCAEFVEFHLPSSSDSATDEIW